MRSKTQKSLQGHRLQPVAQPNYIEVHPVDECGHCQATYFNSYQLIPVARTSAIFGDLHGHELSEASVLTANQRLEKQVLPANQQVKEALQGADEAHIDESGVHIEGV